MADMFVVSDCLVKSMMRIIPLVFVNSINELNLVFLLQTDDHPGKIVKEPTKGLSVYLSTKVFMVTYGCEPVGILRCWSLHL